MIMPLKNADNIDLFFCSGFLAIAVCVTKRQFFGNNLSVNSYFLYRLVRTGL
jgi:hypothetical protein